MPTSKMPTWFITGASSGFGLAFAKYALDRGYSVAATARSVNKLEELAAQAPDRVLTHKLDVTVVDDAEQAIAAAVLESSAASSSLSIMLATELSVLWKRHQLPNFAHKWTPISLARCQ